MPMPPALQKEMVRPGAPLQYERYLAPGTTRRRKKKKAGEAAERGALVREAARAIREGRAEAHPIVAEKGFHGPVDIYGEELADIGVTFAESLIKTFGARQKKPKKPTKPSRMPAPMGDDKFAALFGQ